MRFVFFSMRDFTRDGGGSIRIYGILNALAAKGHQVIFISDAKRMNNFHHSITHRPLNQSFSNKQKAIFQLLLSFLPVSVVSLFYKRFVKNISAVLNEVIKNNEPVYFFEYLDNSIAYFLKKNKIIDSYINDIHGVAPIEFEMQVEIAKNLKSKLLNWFKCCSSKLLDKKVFNNGAGFVYTSNKMKEYYENTTFTKKEYKSYIIPNLLDSAFKRTVNNDLKNELLKWFNIAENTFVFLFSGGYKPTSGVDDLIIVFKKLYVEYPNSKLILIGRGDIRNKCEELASDMQNKIYFLDSIPYEELFTYQSIANVIVCPDKMNPYSNMIVHLKYFDALVSEKLVINGNFDSVKEINKNNFLSLSFDLSNINSLYQTMKNCIDNYDQLVVKYKDVNKYALEHLTYDAYIDVLL